jgi:hypothetical protein
MRPTRQRCCRSSERGRDTAPELPLGVRRVEAGVRQSGQMTGTTEATPTRKVSFVIVRQSGTEAELREAIGVTPDMDSRVSIGVMPRSGGRLCRRGLVTTTSRR